ncbi:dipeptidase [Chondromyces apiculatus]|uniref:Microsomal dipeptidase n=1 Tax=Chondromyces apiculatus DSM 436 TaxID=1192034 RepID=A0A017SUN7_9BACT|nr:membrane dipeptidase [Chondromyces apiculatus]EYF00679.1 Microsomal dipeptidase [Chondromyces apiculatus DSM 436]
MRRGGRALAAVAAMGAAVGTMCVGFAAGGAGGEAEPAYQVVDLHVDVPYQVHFKGRAAKLPEGHATARTLKAGAYGGIVLPIYIPDKARKTGPLIEDADAILATIEGIVRDNPVFLPLGAAEAVPGRISTFLSIEGAGAFADDITQIDRFIDRGVRLISPAHASNTRLASAATGKRVDHGLTELGKAFCARVYARGALIDVSHVSDAAFADLVPIAEAHGAPIVATHSNARAVAGHPRNLTDEELRAIGKSGGVAGLNFHAPFVTGQAEATLDDVVKQAEHMVRVAGVDHVAIGSDFDGGIVVPVGLEDASSFPALAARLRKRGMAQGDVLKIFSLNALRVLGWRPAKAGAAAP